MLNFRSRSLIAGLATAMVLAGCATTPTVAPIGRPGAVGALDSSRTGSASALYTFFALDNDLDHGETIADTMVSTASRTRSVAAAALFDGEARDDSKLFIGNPGVRASHQEIPEVDSGTGAAFGQFLAQAVKQAPGKRRIVSMADHGGGIIRGICSDWNGPGGKKIIHVNEVAAAMQATPADIMLFDACFMNMAEVAYELKDVTKVVIGAQTTTRGDFPYPSIIDTLDRNPTTDNNTLGRELTNVIHQSTRYSGVAFGAVDTTKTPALAASVATLTQVLEKNLGQHKEAMRQAIGSSMAYAAETSPGLAMYNDYKDFGSVMGNLARIPNPEIQQAALAAQAAGKAAVLAATGRSGNGMSIDNNSGMALYATVGGFVEAKYLQRSWNRDSHWGDFLVKLNARGGFSRPIMQDKFPFAFPSKRK